MKKVYCKKNYCTSIKEDKNFSFNEGLYYNIYYYDNICCWLILENGFVQGFYLNYNMQPIFSDYFYTIEELRKLKISKLNLL